LKSNLQAALAFVDEDEGPEVNISPGEPGGASARGLSITVLSEFNKAHGLPNATIDDMRAMTAEHAGQVYAWRFADPMRFNELPSGVDYRMLDAAITLGASGATLALQMSLGMWPVTGVIDEATIAAVNATDKIDLLNRLNAAWIVWKHGLTVDGWQKYGHGWTNRNKRVLNRALDLIKAQ
jgi:lysozyme family protein